MAKLECCNNVFSSNDINSFHKILRFRTTSRNLIIPCKLTLFELIYIAECPNCGHRIIQYESYGKNKAGNKKILDKIIYRGEIADCFFIENRRKFKNFPLKNLYESVKHADNIPFIYGKVIGDEKQIQCYIDDSSRIGQVIESKVRLIKE